MVLATLGGVPLRTNPTDIRWNFTMKTASQRTMGGRVVQILGTTLSDLTVTGTFGSGRRDLGDTEGWQNQVRFRKQVERWAKQTAAAKNPQPLRFTYSPRRWDFQVYVRSFSDVHMANDEINPQWQLVLFPLDDGISDVIRGIKDLYLKRLADGVNWKQSSYNGPTQAEVDSTLAPYGGSVQGAVGSMFGDVFENGSSAVGGGS